MIALFDIDHTVSDAYVRDHLIDAKDWHAYHSQSIHDEPIFPMKQLLNTLYMDFGWRVIALTARSEDHRMTTMQWLHIHKVFVHELIMRPQGDETPTPELKLALFRKRFPVYDPNAVILFDDREAVVQAFRQAGICSLHVHAGGFREGKIEVN